MPKVHSNWPLAVAAAKAYRFRDPSELQALSLTSTGVTDIVNVTEGGIFHGFYISIDATLNGSPVINLEITVDGGTKESIPIFESSTVWGGFGTWQRITAFDVADNMNTSGGTVVDTLRVMGINAAYLTSLKVSINVVTAASSTGSLDCGAFRSTEQ